ncbi:hypothetical protein MPER_05265, partial [Moniliophthora perniciosa FA553]
NFDDVDINIEASAEVDRDGDDAEPTHSHTKPGRRKIVKPKRFRDEEEEEEEERSYVPKAPAKKKRKPKAKKREYSDAETEDDFNPDEEDLAMDLVTLDDDQDDDFVDDEPRRPSKSKVPPKGKGGKSGPSKGKGINAAPIQSPFSKKPRPRPNLNVDTDTFVDIVDDSQSTSAHPVATQDASTSSTTRESSPPPKKRKLPPIKKNKTANSSSTGTPVATTKPGPLKATLEESGLPTKTPAARATTSTDLDLNNGNIYAELFKKPGGLTPRSGLNRREKDEQRRQELNKTRDEARAKRQAEARETFALQAQMEKILRFEERLKKTNSPALFPNIMAAKMREVYDIERKRRQRESNRETSKKPNVITKTHLFV